MSDTSHNEFLICLNINFQFYYKFRINFVHIFEAETKSFEMILLTIKIINLLVILTVIINDGYGYHYCQFDA